MGVIVPVNYGNLSFYFRTDGGTKSFVTSFGFVWGPTAPSRAAIEDIVDLFIASGAPFNTSQMLNEYNLSAWRHTYESASGPLVTDSTGGNIVAGTRTGTPLPPNVALLVRKGTPSGGRRGRGRNFIPPFWLSEGEVDANGVLDATRLEAVNTSLEELLAALTLVSSSPFLFHSDGGTPDEITSLNLESVVATQRRRLRR